MTFEELGISDDILRAIGELGFVEPTPIQEKAIPVMLSAEEDLVALAQTGTGKTATFGLPILQQLAEKNLGHNRHSETQALILAPTRELCMQIAKDLGNYAKYLHLKIVAVCGVKTFASSFSSLISLPKSLSLLPVV